MERGPETVRLDQTADEILDFRIELVSIYGVVFISAAFFLRVVHVKNKFRQQESSTLMTGTVMLMPRRPRVTWTAT